MFGRRVMTSQFDLGSTSVPRLRVSFQLVGRIERKLGMKQIKKLNLIPNLGLTE